MNIELLLKQMKEIDTRTRINFIKVKTPKTDLTDKQKYIKSLMGRRT